MKFFFMMAYYEWPHPNPMLVETIALLKKKGFQVDVGIGKQCLIDLDNLAPTYDLYILKSNSAFWMNIAGILSAQGAHILDPYSTRILTSNKIQLFQCLTAAGISVPQTWATANPLLLESLVRQKPLIIKPATGRKGRGIHIVRNTTELNSLPELAYPVIVQEYLDHLPKDVKIYVIGNHTYGFRKAFSENSFKHAGQPYPLSEKMRALALACGKACQASLYGVDIIETPSGPFVVDLNWFPSYRAIPRASSILADHIITYAKSTETR